MAFKPLAGIGDRSVGLYPPSTIDSAIPALRTEYTDPAFGTIVKRISDYGWGTNSQARHEYSKLMALSHDKTVCVFYMGSGWYQLRNISTGSQIGSDFSGGGLDPELNCDYNVMLAHYRSGRTLRRLDLTDGTNSAMLACNRSDGSTPYFCVYTRQEGRCTFDGAYWAGYGIYTSGFTTRDIIVVDRNSWTICNRLEPMPSPYGDSVSISPLGNYVIVASADSGFGHYWYVYDRTFNESARNLFIDATHADSAVGADGEEYIVYYAVEVSQWQTELGENGPGLARVNIRTGEKTMVWKYPGYMSTHISGQVSKERPGWVLVSTYGSNFGDYACFGECFFFNFHTGAVRRVAHHHRINGGYWGEPQAFASWHGDAVLFASNWNLGRVISNATYATPIQVTTTAAHGWESGEKVVVESVGGNTAANATWIITKVDDTNFTLNGSVGNATYTSGGIVNNRFEDYLVTPPNGYAFFDTQDVNIPCKRRSVGDHWSSRRS